MAAVSFTRDIPTRSLLAGNVGHLTAFEHIQSITVGSLGASSVTFSEIPQDYRHLQIRGVLKRSDSTNGTYLGVRINSDTGTNYASHYLAGDGSATGSSGLSSQSTGLMYASTNTAVDKRPVPGSVANIFAGFVYDVLDYSSTVKNKTGRGLIGHDSNGAGAIQLGSGLWMSTSAVTSVTLWCGGDTIGQFSTFSLYGIR